MKFSENMTILDYLKNERQAWLESGYNREVSIEELTKKKYVECLIADIEDNISNGIITE